MINHILESDIHDKADPTSIKNRSCSSRHQFTKTDSEEKRAKEETISYC